MVESLRKKLIAFFLFTLMVLIGYQINFSQILGGGEVKQYFTFFQFFGPITAGFLGPVIGAGAVLFAEVIRLISLGNIEWISFLRLFPMVFAAIYFGSKKFNASAFISIICMALFVLHPIGGQVWFYSLYWLIPVIAMFFKERLFFKSLGATFTAHSIGSIIWLYSFPSEPSLWLSLIPVVAIERGLFALGITFSYIAFTTVLSKATDLVSVKIDSKYVFSRKMLGF
jgi:hypothetical protein